MLREFSKAKSEENTETIFVQFTLTLFSYESGLWRNLQKSDNFDSYSFYHFYLCMTFLLWSQKNRMFVCVRDTLGEMGPRRRLHHKYFLYFLAVVIVAFSNSNVLNFKFRQLVGRTSWNPSMKGTFCEWN